MSGRLSFLPGEVCPATVGRSNNEWAEVSRGHSRENVPKDRTIFIQSRDWRLEDTTTTENNRMVGSLRRDKVEPKE